MVLIEDKEISPTVRDGPREEFSPRSQERANSMNLPTGSFIHYVFSGAPSFSYT